MVPLSRNKKRDNQKQTKDRKPEEKSTRGTQGNQHIDLA